MFDKNEYKDVSEFKIKSDTISQEACLSMLTGVDLLDYDRKIVVHILERIFKCEYIKTEEKYWQFKLLWIKLILEKEGFFVTTRAMTGGIRILSREEMPFYNEKENKKALDSMKRRQKSLYMIDSSELSKEHAKKLEFEQLRNGSLLIDFHNQMMKRCKLN